MPVAEIFFLLFHEQLFVRNKLPADPVGKLLEEDSISAKKTCREHTRPNGEVLLAEANVPYEQLVELDDINSSFAECDVCLVIGANDTTNPAARTGEGPLAGMPILDVDKARVVVIIKRSLSVGYAGVDNDLFYMDKTMMLFGDGKKMMNELNSALKEL